MVLPGWLCGYTNHTKEIDMVYLDEEEWWNVVWSISGRAGLEKLSAEDLEQFKAEAFEKVQGTKTSGWIPLIGWRRFVRSQGKLTIIELKLLLYSF